MRYARDETGEWPAPRPGMRLRSMGPVQLQAARTLRGLELRSRGAHLPKLRPNTRVLGGLKARANRIFHRDASDHDAIAPAA